VVLMMLVRVCSSWVCIGGGDGDGQDGAGKSKKRVTDLPGYRFKDLDEVRVPRSRVIDLMCRGIHVK